LIVYEFGYYAFVFLAFILGRYFVFAGGTFVALCWTARMAWSDRPWLPKYRLPLIKHDIHLSFYSALVFAPVAALMMLLYKAGYTRIYTSIDEYGWWYLGMSFAIALILQDTYFYFTHRLLHHSFGFRHLHKGHHRSRTPTPWTSFAFEPGEALIHSIFFVGLVFVLPLHYATLIAALMTMTVWAIATHLGFPLIPMGSRLGRLCRGFIGPVHHGIHHRYYKTHFGLYFTFWDHILRTTDPHYSNPVISQRGQ